MQQPELLDIFVRPLETAGITYMITGSVAAIFYGDPRLTHDIDIVFHIQPADIVRFNTLFDEQDFYCPPVEVLHIELRRQVFGHFNIIHHESGLKADFYPASRDPLHLWALQNRRRITLSETSQIWLAPVEYVITRKLSYFREGGSQKHLMDIRNMLTVSSTIIDMNVLMEKVSELGLQSQWQEVG
jgi:hypothetical protein